MNEKQFHAGTLNPELNFDSCLLAECSVWISQPCESSDSFQNAKSKFLWVLVSCSRANVLCVEFSNTVVSDSILSSNITKKKISQTEVNNKWRLVRRSLVLFYRLPGFRPWLMAWAEGLHQWAHQRDGKGGCAVVAWSLGLCLLLLTAFNCTFRFTVLESSPQEAINNNFYEDV